MDEFRVYHSIRIIKDVSNHASLMAKIKEVRSSSHYVFSYYKWRLRSVKIMEEVGRCNSFGCSNILVKSLLHM